MLQSGWQTRPATRFTCNQASHTHYRQPKAMSPGGHRVAHLNAMRVAWANQTTLRMSNAMCQDICVIVAMSMLDTCHLKISCKLPT